MRKGEIADLEWDICDAAAHPFEKFIRKNISSLRKFSLAVYGGPFPQPGTDKLVEQLLECPLLQEIALWDVSKPAESLLGTLQRRGICFESRKFNEMVG